MDVSGAPTMRDDLSELALFISVMLHACVRASVRATTAVGSAGVRPLSTCSLPAPPYICLSVSGTNVESMHAARATYYICTCVKECAYYIILHICIYTCT